MADLLHHGHHHNHYRISSSSSRAGEHGRKGSFTIYTHNR